jgi:16S rRNA (guanine527-N7)-methyltransferase
VGTGAGLPGIVLAITRPDCQLTLLDSNGKKIRFLRQVIADLKLVNAEVVQSRVEAFTGSFDIVTSRAFASLTDMVIGSTHLLHDKGLFLAMKGQEPAQEIAALPTGYAVKDMVSLHVPFLQEERHLLRLIKTEKR